MDDGDGRVRPMLPAVVVHKLHLCAKQMGLPSTANLASVIDSLADAYLASTSAKKQKWGAASAAERGFVSDSALAARE